MKLNKYIFNFAHSIGENKPDVYFKEFAKNLKGFQVEDFTAEELNKICEIVRQGIKEDFYNSVSDYVYDKYEDTDVMTELKMIAFEEGEFEYSDNLRISDGSAIDEAIYFVTKATGCCGFYDDEVIVKGKKYKIGFNYGH